MAPRAALGRLGPGTVSLRDRLRGALHRWADGNWDSGHADGKGSVKARSVVLAAFAVLVAAGLTACGGSSEKSGLGVRTSGSQLKALQAQLLHPHRYTLEQVKTAFATQGISLQKMRSPRGHVVVLFDPRGHPPSGYHYVGRQPSYSFFVVFVHANGQARSWVSDGNVWVANGQGEGPSVDAALHKLDQSSQSP